MFWNCLTILVVFIGFCLPSSLWAAGKRQPNTKTAEGIEIWQKEFDISDLKPGRYNFVISAKDAAGNVGTSGPFNIQIDPKACLPLARVVYPEDGMVIRGELKITGVTSGHYGIKQVLTRLDGAEYSPADGVEYWSRTLDVKRLSEGKHTIYAKAIDSKDLAGPEFSVSFIVDKGPPLVELTSHKTGSLIRGDQNITGSADDPNGIALLDWSADGQTWNKLSFKAKKGRSAVSFSFPLRTKNLKDGPVVYYIRAVDKTGYVVAKAYLFFVNNHPDIPVNNSGGIPAVVLNSPLENETVRGNINFSGIALDDKGVRAVHWRVLTPENPWDSVELTSEKKKAAAFAVISTDRSFDALISFDTLTDGENIVEYFAENIDGLRSEPERRIIRVSSAAPLTVISGPSIDAYNHHSITLTGTAADLNGIRDVLVSMDNGNSYEKAGISGQREMAKNPEGLIDWKFSLNTRVYQDGVYSVMIRTIDNYGIETFSNTLINIDNTPPEISLASPLNGDRVGMNLTVTGHTHDNTTLKGLSLQLVNIADKRQQIAYDIPHGFIIMEQIDISRLSDGSYHLTITAVDMAGNETLVTRGITISKAITASADVDRYGVFRSDLPEELFSGEESLSLQAAYNTPLGGRIESYKHELRLSPWSPVLEIDSHKDGDIITQRPWISGRAFIAISGEEAASLANTEKSAMSLKRVLISFDNGRSFDTARSSGQDWRYRLETGGLKTGPLPILLKAEFADGRTAVRRIILTVDTSPPQVSVLGPAENSAHRDSIMIYGSASDDFAVDSVEVTLRPGDKAGYEVPQFIQGLYLDVHALGATYADVGIGLSFFKDNVRLQFQVGAAPKTFNSDAGRVTGTALGGKIIANVFYLPFDYYFGPGWSFYSMSFALGANFTFFTMDTDRESMLMGAIIAQWTYANLDMSKIYPNWKRFKNLAFYIEPELWFISSDVNAEMVFRMTLGLRANIF